MQATKIDSKSAMNFAWAASASARMNSYANSSSYTSEQRVEVDRAKLLVEMCHSGAVYVNYRKKFVAIKVENGYITDSNMLKQTEEMFEQRGYTKTVTPHAVIYRVNKVEKVTKLG